MKITFILPGFYTFPIGGYRVVYEYADYLAAQGHTVKIIFLRRIQDKKKLVDFVEFFKKSFWKLKNMLLNRPLVSWHRLHPMIETKLALLATDNTIPNGDIVVATGWQTATPVFQLSKSKGKKFYLLQHFETWNGSPDEVRETWHLPMHKIAISKWLMELGADFGVSDIRYIPNGIDLERFRIIKDPDLREFSILSLYHPQPFKGFSDAMEVISKYHDLFPNVPVTIFGAEKPINRIPEWIKYIHNPSQDDLIQSIYNENAIFLSASLTEGWALPPAEAMACGCAFVGTDSGGPRDYAIDDETALLSPPGDKAALLRNLIRITNDRALLMKLQRNGYKKIQSFTWEAAGSALEEYFKNINMYDKMHND